MKKWIIAVIIVGLAGWAVYDFVLSSPGSSKVGIEKGDIAPDFELETIDGDVLQLSDLQGQKVLLNFWATWCPPCRVEIPDLQAYHESHDDVMIVAVNATETENSIRNVTGFVEEYGMTFNVVLDENTIVTDKYEAYSLPTSYLLNSDGTIYQKIIGPLNYELMLEQFSEMY